MISTHTGQPPSFTERWAAFYGVGALGMGVQLGTVWVLTTWASLDYLASTAVGVEVAVLHNFVWHELWTWSDRHTPFSGPVFSRLARFNVANGVVSVLGNVALTALFVAVFGTGYLTGNVIAIAACSLLNFVVADRLVFRTPSGAQRSREPPAGGFAHFLLKAARGCTRPSVHSGSQVKGLHDANDNHAIGAQAHGCLSETHRPYA